MKVSIIIPNYNEGQTIDLVLKKVSRVKLPLGVSKEIIIVDDGSSDNSVAKIKKSKGIKKIFHKKNMGKGTAIRSGLSKASGEIIIIQDADLEYNPNYYPVLISPILKGKADIVYGSRLINYPLRLWGRNKTILPSHLIANKFLTSLTNFLYGSNLSDMETGFKVFKKNSLNEIKLSAKGFDFEPEITAKFLKKGYQIIEIPINVVPRTYKEGKKINFWDGVLAVLTILKLKFSD